MKNLSFAIALFASLHLNDAFFTIRVRSSPTLLKQFHNKGAQLHVSKRLISNHKLRQRQRQRTRYSSSRQMSSNPSNDAEEDPSKKTQETFSPPATTNIDNDNNNDNAPIDKPYLTIAEKEVVGIGGKQGYTYDVNKLKNNLVQKSVRQFKQDLHLLLLNISPPNNPKAEAKRRFQIEEKLAALVSANPVATTTDSNLLEGTWELAFVSNNAKEILDEARFIYSRKSESVKKLKTGEGNWKLSSNSASGKWENPLHTWKRTIFLEALDDDEDPFMIDTVSLFRGLWTVQRFYDVTGVSEFTLVRMVCAL